jgi:hypothetical protein
MTRQRPLKVRILGAVVLFLVFLPVLIVFAASGSGSVSFLPAVPYDSGSPGAASVVVADVNGDGKPDLIVANNWNCPEANCATNGTVGILLGNGDGTFRPAVTYSSGGGFAVSVAVADLNGDGKPDLVVANANGTNVGVLLGNGDGTFQPAVTYGLSGSEGATPETIVIADLNGDGKPDLVVALYGSQVDVLLGYGDGTFRPAVTYGLACCNKGSVAVADVNGDGKPDLLLVFAFCNGCQDGSGQVGVMLGNGDGTFQSQVLYDSGGNYPLSIVVADVNGDGKADLVVGNSCSVESQGYCSGPGSVSVLVGKGDGTFQAAVSYSSPGLSFFSVAVADVNGDGKPDLLAGSCVSTNGDGPVYCGGSADGSVAALIGNGDGTFQPPVLFDAGGFWPISIAAADLNGSGKPDVVVASWRGDRESGYDGSVGVLLNNTPFCTTPPIVTLSAAPTVLWPPKGKMVPVTVSGTITDTGCTVTSAAYAVTDEYGQVQPSGTLTLSAGGAYSFTILLQASRLGTDLDGRYYIITVSASHNGGKTGSQVETIIVPHDGGR